MDDNSSDPKPQLEGGRQIPRSKKPEAQRTGCQPKDRIQPGGDLPTKPESNPVALGIIILLIEMFSLVLWQLADSFHGYACGVVHTLSIACFVAGAAIGINRALKRTKLVWLSYSAVCVLVACVELASYKPPVTQPAEPDNRGFLSISPGGALSPKEPLKTKFILHNQGASELKDVQCFFLWTANKPDLFRNLDPKTGTINQHRERMYRFHLGPPCTLIRFPSFADFTLSPIYYQGITFGGIVPDEIPVTSSDGRPINTNAILLQICCHYTPSLPPSARRMDVFKFYAVPDMDNNFQWFPLGYGSSVWASTNMPNIAD